MNVEAVVRAMSRTAGHVGAAREALLTARKQAQLAVDEAARAGVDPYLARQALAEVDRALAAVGVAASATAVWRFR